MIYSILGPTPKTRQARNPRFNEATGLFCLHSDKERTCPSM